MKIVVDELLKLKRLLKENAADLNGITYKSVADAIKDVDNCIYEFNWDESHALNLAANMLSFQSDIYTIAENNGWRDEFCQISNAVSQVIGRVRIEEKNNSENFYGIKDDVYSDASSFAGDPGRLTLSKSKWKDIGRFYKLNIFQRIELNSRKKLVRERICYGDTQPAVVMSVDPLLIASYADEMDAVVILRFPAQYAAKYSLKLYDRLICVNTYADTTHNIPHDIYVGKHYLKRWSNFAPSVAEFLSDDKEIIEKHKATMPESLWLYVKSLGEEYLTVHKNKTRLGFWFLACIA